MYHILVINPGSTSTKVAYYQDHEPVYTESIHHSVTELAVFNSVIDQFDFRYQLVEHQLSGQVDVAAIDAWVGRGGLLKPIPGGTYVVDQDMVHDLTVGVQGEHASNLGGLLANRFASKYNKPAYIVDPVVVDELDDLARYAGHRLFERKSIFHALNHKAVARKASDMLGKPYESLNLVIAHLGGGISVAAHRQGRVIDVNNALDGEGPFSPERSGTLPAGDLVRLCFSGEYCPQDICKMLTGKGGLVSYTGSNNIRELLNIALQGDAQNDTRKVLEAMARQIAKEIAAMAAVMSGNVDAIVLTGGIVHNKTLVEWIKKRVAFIANILEFPGEEEMEALALGALRVLNGQELPKIYAKEAVRYDNIL